MSAKTFDLAEIEQDARDDYVMRREDTLALVAAVRCVAAYLRELDDYGSATSHDMRAALAPFTDSAEVRSDGE